MNVPKGFAWRRSTGLYYSAGRLTIAHASIEATGQRSYREHTLEVAPEDLQETVAELREEGVLKGTIACSLDLRSLISLTRRLSDEELSRGAHELLKEHVGSVDGGLATGCLPIKLSRGQFTSLYAFPRGPVADLLSGLGKLRAAQRCMVPLPLALVSKLRTKAAGKPRKWGTWVSVLAGPGFGLALLCHGKQPLAMRLFASRLGVLTASAVEGAVLGLQTFARDELGLEHLDGVLLHTGIDDEIEAHADELERLGGWEVVLGPRVVLDESTLARSLADYGLGDTHHDPDLFAELVQVNTAWDNLPIRSLLGLAGAILLGAASLFWQAMMTETDASLVTGRAKALAAQAGVKLKGLTDEHKRLKKEVKQVSAFADQRLFWEDYLRELPELIPETMFLVRLDGKNLVRWSEKSKGETRLSVTAEVPLPFIDGTPVEVTEFTEAIQASELFQDQLPRIRGSNVRFQSGVRESKARMVVLCSTR